MKAFRNEWILLAILLLGLFLRIYHLGNESIWLDEAVSIKWANSNLFHILRDVSGDVHVPLYPIVLHLWVYFFGDSEFSIRFPSLVFGFIAIFMIYKVGAVIFDKEVGILSALLLALSSFHIYYSREARMYSLMALLTLLSIYFFINLLKERSLLASIGYIVSSILLMYTHIYGLFIIVAQNIYVVTMYLLSKEDYKLNLRVWILLQALLIALFTPWIGTLVKRIKYVESSGFWIPAASIHSIIETFITYSNSKLLLFLFIVLASFSVVTYDKTRGNMNWKDLFNSIESYKLNIRFSSFDWIYLLLLWLLSPIFLPFIISRFSTPIYLDRYTIGASLAFYILVAAGIRNIGHKYVKLVIIGIITIFSLEAVRGHYTTIHKEQWRDIASYIDTNAKERDLLIFNAYWYQIPFDYYSKRTDLIKKPFPAKTRDVNEMNIKELGPTVEGNNRVWVILCYSGDNTGLIKKTLISESFNLSYRKEYAIMNYGSGTSRNIDVYLFEKK